MIDLRTIGKVRKPTMLRAADYVESFRSLLRTEIRLEIACFAELYFPNECPPPPVATPEESGVRRIPHTTDDTDGNRPTLLSTRWDASRQFEVIDERPEDNIPFMLVRRIALSRVA